jgi:hypothetical protein
MKKIFTFFAALLCCSLFTFAANHVAYKASMAPTIDGVASENCWTEATWYPIDQVWIPWGTTVSSSDFSGRFKITWTDDKLYILAEITDDLLSDDHASATDQYWEDDCLEVFIDEDDSGGDHEANFNAWAYHVSTSYDAVDLNENGWAQTFNDHVDVVITNDGNVYTWELAIDIYDDTYDNGGSNTPVTLVVDKVMGLSLAYCDNDEGNGRENFIGSTEVTQSRHNHHWQDATDFGMLTLAQNPNTSTESISISELKVFPNPVQSGEILTITSEDGLEEITVYNITGSKVKVANGNEINTSSLSAGKYILQVRSKGEVHYTNFIVTN